MNLPSGAGAAAKPSRFLTRVADALHRHGHSYLDVTAMVQSSRRFIIFHGLKRPQEMGRTEAIAYLEHIATQNERFVLPEPCRFLLPFVTPAGYTTLGRYTSDLRKGLP